MSAATGPIQYSSSAYRPTEDPQALGSPSSQSSSSLSSIMTHQYSYASSTSASSAASSPSSSPHQSYPQYAQYPVANGPLPHAHLSFHPQQFLHPQGSSPSARIVHHQQPQQQQPASPVVYTASTPQQSQHPHHHLQPQPAPHSSSPITTAASSYRRPSSPQPAAHDGGSSPGAHSHSAAVSPMRPPGSPLPSSHGALTSLPLPPRGPFPSHRYSKIRTIRKTLFGKVVLYQDTERQRQVAIKLSDKALLERGTTTTGNKVAENPMEEICIMNILSGGLLKPGISRDSLPADVRAGERYVLTSLGEYEDEAFLYTVMPFCGKGEFFDLVCFPERDTRVLTDTGFLFLREIEARIARDEPVRYACYDTTTKAVVYSPGELKLDAPDPDRWVDFTQAATRRVWDATSDDYGGAATGARRALKRANRISIRTTPQHEMYVQLGQRAGLAQQGIFVRTSGRAEMPAHKMRAEELAPGYRCRCKADSVKCPHGYGAYRLFTGAPSGIAHADVMSVNDTAQLLADRPPTERDSPVFRLGLRSEDQLNAFLELYGYWLGDGSMHYYSTAYSSVAGGVAFAPKKERDQAYVLKLIERLCLRSEEWASWRVAGGSSLVVHITAKRWCHYFDKGYGIKYEGSQYFDREAAIAKLGNRPLVRPASRPSPSTATTPPATPRTGTGERRDSVSFSSRSRTPSSAAVDMGLAEDEGEDVPVRVPFHAATPPSITRSLRSSSLSSPSSSSPSASAPSTPLSVSSSSFSEDEDEDEEKADGSARAPFDLTGVSGEDVKRDEAGAVIPARSERKKDKDEDEPVGPVKREGPDDDEPDGPGEDENSPDEPDEPGEPYDPEEETPAKSCKWFWWWVMKRLNKDQLRLVIEGLRWADGVSAPSKEQVAAMSECSGERKICTSSVAFRDELVQTCLHAGYSAFFTINTRAGTVRGYNAVPSDRCIYSREQKEELLQADSSRVFKPVQARHDNWLVHYLLATAELLDAADVRYDGKALRLREKQKRGQGYVALHRDGGPPVLAATQLELGAQIGDLDFKLVSKVLKRRHKQTGTGGQLFTAAEYAAFKERAHGTGSGSSSASAATKKADARSRRDGRTWCVKVEHDDHLIFVQRAHRDAAGIVTKASKPVIIGNCFETRFAEEKARKYFTQMVRGVRYMHAMGMVHLDLSLENLLMTDEDVLKICDYGVTRQLRYNTALQPPQPELFRASTTNKPGKMGYMAPEIFSAKEFSGPLADVWSMGIVLFISLFGVPPYQIPAASDQRFALIFSGQLWRLLTAWKMTEVASKEAVDLLSCMLCPQEKRISLEEILRHPWLRGATAAPTPVLLPQPQPQHDHHQQQQQPTTEGRTEERKELVAEHKTAAEGSSGSRMETQ